jgi:hypothetical protein
MEFQSFPKIPRLNREVIVSEKIDGTNAQIVIVQRKELSPDLATFNLIDDQDIDGTDWCMLAGSRNRYLRLGDDNFGFAHWVSQNWAELLKLGHGQHHGEWWGQGIQRGYGLDHKRFSLFNTSRWGKVKEAAFDEPADKAIKENPFNTVPGLDVVPFIAQGKLQEVVDYSIMLLREHGSHAAPGFKDPEGVVVFHTASNGLFKVTLEQDDAPKSKTH